MILAENEYLVQADGVSDERSAKEELTGRVVQRKAIDVGRRDIYREACYVIRSL